MTLTWSRKHSQPCLKNTSFGIQDNETVNKLTTDCVKKQLYREIASTAESGWDCSTRWMKNMSNLTTLSTTMIVPVDLNAFILKI
ncbi:probable trehalase isoform X1 [Rutidosis leptorrhynchoides]|uniref:probable trehalase isoform X1 n=1 Tax=Rutidosis leptorrhynchoides TaxID=125765 RepID=UPI003A99B5F4